MVRDTRPVGFSLTVPTGAATIEGMMMRLDLTRRRHVDLARVSSASCCPVA
ncbi:putative leader peptide [Streptomyces sp. NPDC088387]|uniref:putative leader peptide n=1 Tax=Streptomyces sp. NPDC088387 TaxID=3365859 RepID=UPI00380B5C68